MSKQNKSRDTWYRFVDDNTNFDYKTVHNAIVWAAKKVMTSTSGEIRVFKVSKKSNPRALELECIAFTKRQRPVDNLDAGTLIVWRDQHVYNEFKRKEHDT